MLTFTTQRGYNYRVEATRGLETPINWVEIITLPGTGAAIRYEIQPAADVPLRFYRVVVER